MKSGELQYISDTLLLQEIANLEFGLTKRASLFQDLNLDSIRQSIQTFVKEHVSQDAPGGYLGSVLSLMTPAILLRINPLLGVIYLAASQFGFDINGIIAKIQQAIKNKLESGTLLTPSDVTEIGKEALGNLDSTAAPEDWFLPLKKYATPSLESFAQGLFSKEDITSKLFGNTVGKSLPETPILGGKGGVLQKVFGTLFNLPGGRGKSKALWLIGGFIIWTIKTVLLGAGLLAGAEMIHKLLAPKTKEEPKPVIENEDNLPISNENKIENIHHHEEPIKPNSTSDLWIVPLLGTVENTLLAWIEDLAPNITEKIENFEQQLFNSHIFKELTNLLKAPGKLGKKVLIMPEQFTSRKQVVDLLLKDFNETIH